MSTLTECVDKQILCRSVPFAHTVFQTWDAFWGIFWFFNIDHVTDLMPIDLINCEMFHQV